MPLSALADPPLFRPARAADLPALVAILAADVVGGHGDTTDPEAFADYAAAYRAVAANPGTRLYVAELDGRVVGTYELILAYSLHGRGALRAIIEAVHVAPDLRGRGIGAGMVRHAMDEARAAGAMTLGLTSGRRREAAHRFYEGLGFAPSHLGFKIAL